MSVRDEGGRWSRSGRKHRGEGVKEFSLGTSERASYGMVVTIVRVDVKPRQVDTVVGHGTAMDALRQVAEHCDFREGDWRIRTICSPITIMRDLYGTREVFGTSSGESVLALPEPAYLGRLGRADLLERP